MIEFLKLLAVALACAGACWAVARLWLDPSRIARDVRASGGELLNVLGERRARTYRVDYRDAPGLVQRGTCRVGRRGVQWLSKS